MSAKIIKVKTATYNRLKQLMQPHDTFDSVILKLIEENERLKRKVEELERRLEEEKERLAEEIATKKVESSVDAIDLDKAAWYITKTAFSIQALKDMIETGQPAPMIDQQFKRVLKNLQQLQERYGINVRTVAEIVQQYYMDPSKENKILLNEATKELMKSILVKLLSLQILR